MKRFWILCVAAAVLGCGGYEPAKPPADASVKKQAGGVKAAPPAVPSRAPSLPPAPTSFGLPSATPAGGPPAALAPLDASSLPKMLLGGEPGVPAWAGQDKDEPFDVKQFLESRAAPDDNAAPLYFAAMAEISGDMYLGDQVRAGSSWPWKAPPPPQVMALQDSIRNLSNIDKLKDRSMPLAEIERVLAAAKPAEQRLDEAQQKAKCVFIYGMDLLALERHVMPALQFARLSRFHLYHARVKGDYEEAEQSIRRVLRLSRDLRPRGSGGSQAASNSVAYIALSAINDFTLSQPGLTAERCDRLLALLAEHRGDPISPLQEGMRVHYIQVRNTLDAIEHGRFTLKQLEGLPAVGLLKIAQATGTMNWHNEAAVCNRIFAAAIARASLPLNEPPPPSKPFQQEIANMKELKALVLVALLSLSWYPAPDVMRDHEAQRQAFLAGTECLIAVRRYALAHGTLPPDLQTAAREAGLPSVPTDAFSGQPMRYRVLNGKPLVYSVGPDRKDDGGLVQWPRQDGGGDGDLLFRIGE